MITSFLCTTKYKYARNSFLTLKVSNNGELIQYCYLYRLSPSFRSNNKIKIRRFGGWLPFSVKNTTLLGW